MSLSDKKLTSHKDIIEFTLPRLHRGKQWYVDFFAYDPISGGLKRKKYMLDRYKTTKERETMASILIHNIYQKLIAGWNPFTHAKKTRHYTEFSIVVQRYADYITVAEQKGILKHKTAIDYKSRLKQLQLYLLETNVNIKYVYQFDRTFAVDFLDYLIFDKDVNSKTRNNYRTWLSTLGTWLKERQYIEANPIEDIHMMKETDKFRDPLPADALKRLHDYTYKYMPSFYLACMMEYYTFIRPDELRYIKIGDISITEQTVYVSSEISKNRKGQTIALNDSLLKLMIELRIFEHPSSDYLFGKDIIPGPKQIYVNRFRQEWGKVRRALHFPDSYQFYSLKDSGIRDLANAEGIVVARDQARHSDVAVTNRYLKQTDTVHEQTKHYKGNL
ncbi:site-specific recombinase, phage integrase family [Prevotella sp. DNF00663]|uniref:tyrosine-type recombinase/integrase n=1 Tax=Prevotella sp. DNF00663 TaxID=1384078 RepID=UPI000784DA77|nr:tyrosine-type recombinase/integrase [Prevotella sp. DNF00663]KXB86077.1 site-specific recombinase, phage integrase family [Prevotella sp. DNF00663]